MKLDCFISHRTMRVGPWNYDSLTYRNRETIYRYTFFSSVKSKYPTGSARFFGRFGVGTWIKHELI